MIESGSVKLADGETLPLLAASTLNNLRAIRQTILRDKPTSTLEIGLAHGASALTFLSTLRENGTSGFHHTAIDPYQSGMWKGAAIQNIAAEGLSEHFLHIERDSALALPELCSQSRRYDLIYVDGSHLFEDVFVDFFFSCRLLSHGGVILFDDCTDKHVKKVIRFINANFSRVLQREKISDFSGKSLKSRIGNALGIRQLVAYRKIAEPPRRWDAPFSGF
jgi:predicted O-methyltransferase YrrM